MAAIDESKLKGLCETINSASNDYVQSINNAISGITDAFNQNWVSTSARELAAEISQCIDSLTTAITKTFEEKSDAIKISVENINREENEAIGYIGFTMAKPSNINITLNATLPNGKIGLSDNADIYNAINTPMNGLKANVDSALSSINDKVRTSDAFDANEQEALTTSINNIKNAFMEKMEELNASLKTRLEAEQNSRNTLDSINRENLS